MATTPPQPQFLSWSIKAVTSILLGLLLVLSSGVLAASATENEATDDSDTSAPATDDSDTSAPATDDSDTPTPATDDSDTPTPATDDSDTPTPATDDSDTSAPATDDSDTSAPATDDSDTPTPATDDVVGTEQFRAVDPRPTCSSSSMDPDGDGYGWENHQTCIIRPKVDAVGTEQFRAVDPRPTCLSSSMDPDGDGYGWENHQTCIIQPFSLDVLTYAEQSGLGVAQALEDLRVQSRLAVLGDEVASTLDGFEGFQIVRENGVSVGLIATTSDLPASAVPEGLAVRVVQARFTAEEVEEIWNERRAALQAADSSIRNVTYDPFSDTAVIWRRSNPDEASPGRNELDELVAEIMTQAGLDSYDYREMLVAGPIVGGLPAYKAIPIFPDDPDGSGCTTGFGVESFQDGETVRGYITAGHCAPAGSGGDWKINTPSQVDVTTRWDATIGGYVDRVILEASGAAAEVQFNNGGQQVEPVSPDPIRAFPGMFLCRYGKVSNDLQCGFLDSVNAFGTFEVDGRDYDMFWDATAPDGSVSCVPGDSGGPVWLPGNWDPAGVNRAAGLISATVPSQTIAACTYR